MNVKAQHFVEAIRTALKPTDVLDLWSQAAKNSEFSLKVFKTESMSLKVCSKPVSYTHLRAHETGRNLVCRLLLEKKWRN